MTPRGGVVVNSRDEVLMVQERVSPLAAYQGAWKLPGGLADPGEHFAETVAREVRERGSNDPFACKVLRDEPMHACLDVGSASMASASPLVSLELPEGGGFIVSDAGNNKLTKFNADGSVAAGFFGVCGYGYGATNCIEPSGLAMYGDELFVVDEPHAKRTAYPLTDERPRSSAPPAPPQPTACATSRASRCRRSCRRRASAPSGAERGANGSRLQSCTCWPRRHACCTQ